MSANLAPVLTQLASLFGVIVIGALLKVLGILPAELAPLVSRVVMTLTLPALVFTAIRSAGAKPFSLDLLKMPLLAAIVIAASWVLAWLAARALHLNRPQTGAFILASIFGSTAFLGYPIITALATVDKIGDTGQLAHVLYSEIGTLVALVTFGLIVASIYGEGAEVSWRNLLAVPRAAPFIALMLGLLFYSDPLPGVITNLMNLMGQTTSFLMMLYLGMSIVGTGVLAYWRPVLVSQGIKLLFAPLLGVLLVALLGMQGNPDLLKVAVIDSSTPSILLCLAYAAQYKLDLRLATTLVFSSFVLSLITMGLWLTLVIQ
ncbi:MAG TPA: AEC family transporter [Chloroflexia bacterium]|jgi:predicted permease|nr:AEC family transporter [Chloroflexia bacterium]